MSLVDANTLPPCVYNEETKLYEHANVDVWQCIADGLVAYNAGTEIQTLSASTSIFDETGTPVSANPMSFTSNEEFAFAMLDAEGKLLFGIRNDGSVYQCAVDDLTQAKLDEIINTIGLDVQEKIDVLSVRTEDIYNTLEGFSGETLNALAELDDALFPIEVQFSVVGDSAVSKNTISYSLKRKNVPFTPDTVTIGKQLNDGQVQTIHTATTPSGSIESPIEANAEGFVVKAVKAGKTPKSATAVRYVCFYGGNVAESGMTMDVMSGLTKVETSTANINPKISTHSGEFIWIIVPNELFINRVTSEGFDVTMKEPEQIVTSMGIFKGYRTLNRLADANWALKVEGYSTFQFNYDDVDYTVYYTKEAPIENPEYKEVILDLDEKVLWGQNVDDTIYAPDLTGYTVEDGTKVSKIINYIISNP